MGPGTRKWLQTDREGVSYHYHSKLGEVLAGLWRRVSKRKSRVYTYLHYTSAKFSMYLYRAG